MKNKIQLKSGLVLPLLMTIFVIAGTSVIAFADDAASDTSKKDSGNPVTGFVQGTGETIAGLGEGTGKVLKGTADGTGQAISGFGEGTGQVVKGVGEGTKKAYEGVTQQK